MESQLKELQKDAYGFSTLPLHRGDVVLDVGANVGVVSTWLAKLYPGIRIIAIELDPTNFRFMLWNLHRNNAPRRHLVQSSFGILLLTEVWRHRHI